MDLSHTMKRLNQSITRTLLMTFFLAMAYIGPVSAQSSNFSLALGGKTFTGVGEVLKIEIDFDMDGAFGFITAAIDKELMMEGIKVSLESSNLLEISLTESVDGGGQNSTKTVFTDISTANGSEITVATSTTTADGKTSRTDEIEVTTKSGGTITIVVGEDGDVKVFPAI